jgi:ferritin-like metal-binding protein YciE
MAGLIAEGEDLLREDYEADVQDAGIIGAAQRVEHYEIAAYGTARAFAERLGRDEAVELLQETLDEEKEADEKLTEIAEASTNVRASREEEGERHARKSRPKRTTNAGRSRRSSRSRSSTHR